ncbi:unnamed protein product [Rhizoctonia solani]|uniref:CBM1 domain-containing protein n=1 Tax=Rhizoctonia solani TaxID=456999 RepID=A0A8H3BGY5_9AGAM|nr:unnamed protein product [Rhizoctonia solani]
MFNKFAALTFVSALAGQVMGHGLVTSPPIRQPGDAFKANCGEQMYYNVESDAAGNIQQLNQLKATSFSAGSCNLNLCKGLQFADVSSANIQSWTAGQVIPIKVDIRAPHTGTANVSIIDTASNAVIGSPLKVFEVYASTSSPITADQTSFNVTIPDLGSKCTTAGACVLQWWWDARSIDQTYESCVDFTQSGSGSGAPVASTTAQDSTTAQASATAVATSAAVTSTAAAATSTAAAVTSVVTSVAQPTTTARATTAAPTTTAAPASSAAPAPCGGNIQAREVRVNAKWARCGGIGWFGTTTCPQGLTCHSYNDYYSACI